MLLLIVYVGYAWFGLLCLDADWLFRFVVCFDVCGLIVCCVYCYVLCGRLGLGMVGYCCLLVVVCLACVVIVLLVSGVMF